MNKKFLFLIGCLFTINICWAQNKDESEVLAVLTTQPEAWNATDINVYMQAYWKSDSLMFIGKNGINYGWQNTLDNYKKNYPDATTMGKLDFSITSIKRLSVLYFHVVAKWHLVRTKEKGDLEGYTTLLFKKIKGHWVIVADHSS